MKEKPKKIKVESRTSRTERSSFRERRPKEEREQFDKPRSNRGDRKERKPKKYDEKQKGEFVPVVLKRGLDERYGDGCKSGYFIQHENWSGKCFSD